MTVETATNDWKQLMDIPLLYKTLSQIPIDRICPDKDDVFKAFQLCALKDCKIIFLGQDPYPQKGVATGILFGNKDREEISPSLQIIKEAVIDYTKPHNYPIYFDNSLESWAKQGILMLNSALTVEINKIGSHTQLWRPFISKFLKNLSEYGNYLFVLFGKQAQTFEPYINKNHNHILKENHPAYFIRSNKRMSHDIFTSIDLYMKGVYNEKIVWYTELSNEIEYVK